MKNPMVESAKQRRIRRGREASRKEGKRTWKVDKEVSQEAEGRGVAQKHAASAAVGERISLRESLVAGLAFRSAGVRSAMYRRKGAAVEIGAAYRSRLSAANAPTYVFVS